MKKIFFITVFFPLLLFSQVRVNLINENWKFRKVGDKEWMMATVPGTVHTDLLANKKIPDPFSQSNEKQLQWIETCDWEYETIFGCDDNMFGKQNMELQFEGLDTYAKVYLNDTLIIITDNMFRTWKADVKKYLKFPQSKLRIVFESAVSKGKELAKKLPYTLPENERVFTRKAQYQYGWDFAPRFVTCGIYKNVKLVLWNNAKLNDIQVIQESLNDTLAKLSFNCEVNCSQKGDYYIYVTSSDKENKGINSAFNTPLLPGKNSYELPYSIKNPRRWWCNGIGRAELYNFSIELIKDGRVLDKKNIVIGLRAIELVQERDAAGKSFYFKLNGVPVFMKGANYIPPDNFLPRVTNENYKRIIQNAVDANMNMLRVWGGGVYAEDEFYKLCDEKGILVWQDFVFACAMYPGDSAFIKNVKQEAAEQVRRLRNHPSIALWCGNNEIEEGWKNWGWQKQFNYSKNDSINMWGDYLNLFEKILPEIVMENDSQRNYWASSPLIGWGHKESLLSGDAHYWGIWWGMEPFENYNKKVGRFMSEYGFQGMPTLSTINKNCGDSLLLNGSCIKNLQKHPKGFQTINAYMDSDYRIPTNFEDYVYVSQLVQARGMEIAIEAHRRSKPYCMGSLYWQLNDCWPGISWSTIDYYRNWKAAHYSIRKSFENVVISIADEADSLKIFVISDLLYDTKAELAFELFDFNGKVLWNKYLPIEISKNSSKKLFTIPKSIVTTNKNAVVLKCSFTSLIKQISKINKYYYFVSPKDLKMERPVINCKWISGNSIELTTGRLAKNIFLSYTGNDAFFSDNYFDLIPGEKKIVQIKANIIKRENLKIRSLIDVN